MRVAGFNARKAVSENAIYYQIKTVGYMSIVPKYILKIKCIHRNRFEFRRHGHSLHLVMKGWVIVIRCGVGLVAVQLATGRGAEVIAPSSAFKTRTRLT